MISLEGVIYMQSLRHDADLHRKIHVSCIMSDELAFAVALR